ncbi:MAG: C4-dicarboxylate ABC transporter substrate-binding protein [Betaproteobacteria bacterium]|nr:C4-dicarboxylate ABC transporter substrate-binding protein [Betaproteobacteria bacterium]
MIKRKFKDLSRRDLLLTIVPVVLLALAIFVFAFRFVEPAPPDTIVISTGAIDSGYHMFAQRYQEILARDGVKLELLPSAGSQENVSRLLDEKSAVEVGFLQGGSAFATNAPELVSLGSLYYEPLWVFYRGPEIHDFGGLHGKKLAIGPEESGTRALALQLLAVNATVMPPTLLLPENGQRASEMLLQGRIDAVFMVEPPESPLVEQLVSAPGIRLLNLDRAEAYTRRFPALTRLTLPQGVFDFVKNVPARDVTLISPTANLLAVDGLHPALAYLLMRAGSEIHGGAGLLHKAGDFPAPLNSEFPLSAEAKRYYKSGPPFLQRYLPYWAAVLVDRLWITLLPVLALLLPLGRIAPAVYRWRVRSRIYRWYAKLKEVELELELDDNSTPEKLTELLTRLDQIERAVNRINTPLAYTDNLYAFRQNVDLVRQRVRAQLGSGGRGRRQDDCRPAVPA